MNKALLQLINEARARRARDPPAFREDIVETAKHPRPNLYFPGYRDVQGEKPYR